MNNDLTMPSDNKLTKIDRQEVYDLLIIGAGPAGLTSAVYSLRKLLKTALVTDNIGGQILETASLENYMGYRFIEGYTLADKFHSQIKEYPLAFEDGVRATDISQDKDIFIVSTNIGKSVKAKSVIIAAGKSYRRLGVDGEKEFTGKGVAYCATCDAPLFRDKVVAVVGGGNSGIEAVLELANIAKRIIIIQNSDKLTADPIMIKALRKYDNIEYIYNAAITKISGKMLVNKIEYTENSVDKSMSVDGVFVKIGMIPNTHFVKGFLELNKQGEIVIDNSCKTNVDGIFAAGDVSSVVEKQIIIAAGEGAKAALSAYKFILKHHNLNITK